ncbi:MAG: hypothetical protein AAFV90_24645 [Cyanobacteria bacterium J06634_5]
MVGELANGLGLFVHHWLVLLIVYFSTMGIRQMHSTSLQPETTADTGVTDVALQARILIELAMEQAQFSDTDTTLIARQLAGELKKIEVSLSDVRLAVLELYQGEREAAEAYLDFLAQCGFPEQAEPMAHGAEPCTLTEQQQAITQADTRSYGQLPQPLSEERGQHHIVLYPGNLVSELVANSAFSALVFGERRSGTSALLRAIAYDRIEKSPHTLLDILDFHNGQWGGLEEVRGEDGSQMVHFFSITHPADIEPVGKKLSAIASEVQRRQRQQRAHTLTPQPQPPYLFLIEGLSELHGALPGWSADRRSKDEMLSRSASHLRFILCHGPTVGISCVATARDHSRALCDATALGETKLLFLGRVSAGRNGGYRAIDQAIEDKALLPSPHDRSRFREVMSAIKPLAYPVVFTANGVPRLGRLGNFSSYLSQDLLAHYQHALEARG